MLKRLGFRPKMKWGQILRQVIYAALLVLFLNTIWNALFVDGLHPTWQDETNQ